MEKQQNIQDAFLNALRKEGTAVTVYLLRKLSGRIRSFDKSSVVLETSSQEQLIFKHAISNVVVPRAETSTSVPRVARGGGRQRDTRRGSLSAVGTFLSEVISWAGSRRDVPPPHRRTGMSGLAPRKRSKSFASWRPVPGQA